MTESVTTEEKSMRLAAYIGLCFIAWITGIVVANSISAMMGDIYAQATFPVIIGFWAGKVALKNKCRNWGGIVAFPSINFIAALLGFSLSQSHESAALICIVISFMLSCGLFALLNTNHSVTG